MVIPIFKKGDKYLPSNYRPISLLSTFSKLLEKVMYKRLYSNLQGNNILYRYQFGFRKNHSTALALIDVVDSICQYLDHNETVIGLYLDLQKAFDTVSHKILLQKLCTRYSSLIVIFLEGNSLQLLTTATLKSLLLTVVFRRALC